MNAQTPAPAWDEFKLLVDTTRGYVDIAIKTATIFGGVTTAIIAYFGTKTVDDNGAAVSPLLQHGGLVVGAILSVILLIAFARAFPVAQSMDQRMRALGVQLDIKPVSHVGVLLLSLAAGIGIFGASALAYLAAWVALAT